MLHGASRGLVALDPAPEMRASGELHLGPSYDAKVKMTPAGWVKKSIIEKIRHWGRVFEKRPGPDALFMILEALSCHVTIIIQSNIFPEFEYDVLYPPFRFKLCAHAASLDL